MPDSHRWCSRDKRHCGTEKGYRWRSWKTDTIHEKLGVFLASTGKWVFGAGRTDTYTLRFGHSVAFRAVSFVCILWAMSKFLLGETRLTKSRAFNIDQ